jgi:hypothetical protein
MRMQCQNCDWTGAYEAANPAEALQDRLSLGDPYTDVECPACGALAQLVRELASIIAALTYWAHRQADSVGVSQNVIPEDAIATGEGAFAPLRRGDVEQLAARLARPPLPAIDPAIVGGARLACPGSKPAAGMKRIALAIEEQTTIEMFADLPADADVEAWDRDHSFQFFEEYYDPLRDAISVLEREIEVWEA